MVQISKEQTVTFTKEEVEDILKDAAKKLLKDVLGDECVPVEGVRWDIKMGDHGPKDPLDYSDYEPTQVKSVSITLKG